jgi:hypothetical protein
VKRKNSKSNSKRGLALKALKKESDLDLIDQIRRLLAVPPHKRTNFLRVKILGGSHL